MQMILGTGKTHTILGLIAVLLQANPYPLSNGAKILSGSTLRQTALQTENTNTNLNSNTNINNNSNNTNNSNESLFKKQRQRILICAPSNIAIDECIYRIHKQGLFKSINYFYLFSVL